MEGRSSPPKQFQFRCSDELYNKNNYASEINNTLFMKETHTRT